MSNNMSIKVKKWSFFQSATLSGGSSKSESESESETELLDRLPSNFSSSSSSSYSLFFYAELVTETAF